MSRYAMRFPHEPLYGIPAEEITALLIAADWYEERDDPVAGKLRKLSQRLLASVPLDEVFWKLEGRRGISFPNVKWLLRNVDVSQPRYRESTSDYFPVDPASINVIIDLVGYLDREARLDFLDAQRYALAAAFLTAPSHPAPYQADP